MKIITKPLFVLSTLLLIGCGGGGGDKDKDSNASNSIVRPKTLNGITLKVGQNMEFKFTANQTTAGAELNGETETGNVEYTPVDKDSTFSNENNSLGTKSNVFIPNDLINASYEYIALNQNSARIILKGTPNTINTYSISAQNIPQSHGWITDLFVGSVQARVNGNNFAVPIKYTTNSNTVIIDISFNEISDGIEISAIDLSIAGSSSGYDKIIPTEKSIQLTAGGNVPKNYAISSTVVISPVPSTFNKKTYNFTDATITANSFAIQFTADFSSTSSTTPDATSTSSGGSLGKPSSTKAQETGKGLLTIGQAGNSTAVPNAVDYTLQTNPANDQATLTISGLTGNYSAYNGVYVMSFISKTNGNYTGVFNGSFNELISLPTDTTETK